MSVLLLTKGTATENAATEFLLNVFIESSIKSSVERFNENPTEPREILMQSISPIAAFRDNYIWCIGTPTDDRVFVVDPGDAAPVIEALQQKRLAGILITHHHSDHVGGLPALLERFDVPVYGPYNPAISLITQRVRSGDSVNVLGAEYEVMEVPGHTLDHIAYFSAASGSLFCGDTLFSAGCGRLFEGSAKQMYASLSKLSALPGNTKVYCAHEYTMANIAFASDVEPDNLALQEYARVASELRSRQQPTLPSTITRERAVNPFLRANEASIKSSAEAFCGHELTSPEEVFQTIRGWKDCY